MLCPAGGGRRPSEGAAGQRGYAAPLALVSDSLENRVETEIGVIESNLVEKAVEGQLGREPSVSVSPVGETDIVEISATSTEPEEAAAEANLYAQTYVQWKRQRTIDDLLAAQQTVQAEVDALEQ